MPQIMSITVNDIKLGRKAAENLEENKQKYKKTTTKNLIKNLENGCLEIVSSFRSEAQFRCTKNKKIILPTRK